MLPARFAGWIVLAVPWGIAFVMSTKVEQPPRPSVPLAAQVEAFATTEAKLRSDSAHNFPRDRWSADDDFHNAERRWVHGLASSPAPTFVFEQLDRNLRAGYPNANRKVTASPCKPRPFYD